MLWIQVPSFMNMGKRETKMVGIRALATLLLDELYVYIPTVRWVSQFKAAIHG